MNEFEQWYEKIWGHLKDADFIDDVDKELIKKAAEMAWEKSAQETKIKMIEEGWRK
jgi:hypothetical protein